MSGAKWEPISTAPKDGTHILALWHGPDPVTGTDWSDYPPEVISWLDGEWGARGEPYMEPTHWMPLPPPPEKVE